MPTKTEIKEEVDFYSSRISETSRFVGFGLLASYYALTVSLPDALNVNEYLLLGIGLFGAATILFDYVQYVAGYIMARSAQRAGDPYSYKKGVAATCFGVKTISFVAKQVFAVMGSIGLIALIVAA